LSLPAHENRKKKPRQNEKRKEDSRNEIVIETILPQRKPELRQSGLYVYKKKTNSISVNFE
jgi:hypothetical protein